MRKRRTLKPLFPLRGENMTNQDNDPLYGRYFVLPTPHGPIEIAVQIEAKDLKSGLICLLCVERDLHQGKLRENPEEFKTKEDLMKHVEKEHPDLAYILASLEKRAPSQAQMIV